jgi:predicted permease
LRDWRERSSSFEALSNYYTEDVTDTTGDRPETVRRATVFAGFLGLWKIAPALGRDFTDEEGRFGGPEAALLSDRYWRERMSADPNVVGKTLVIDGDSVAVVGVMPPSFAAVDRSVGIWMSHHAGAPWNSARTNGWFDGVVGRLAPGATLEQARAELRAVQAQLAAEYPETDADLTVNAVPYKDTIVGAIRASLWLLLGAVLLLLLIACTNIAALLLARGAQRERDVAIRYSLGASRASVIRHLMLEIGMLVVVGTAIGLVAAYGAVASLSRLSSALPRFDEVVLDGRTVAVTAVTAAAVTLLCGLLPAFKNSAPPSGRAQVSARQASNWVLVGVQVTLSVTLLAGAGLLLRSFDAIMRIDPGFDAERVLTFRVSGSFAESNDYPGVIARINRTLDELEALPGVERAGTSFAIPGVWSAGSQAEITLIEEQGGDVRHVVEVRSVSPSYFETLGIPLLAGELCRQHERAATEAMVNRSFVERYFPQRSVIGLHIAGPSPDRIAGVVGDARERDTLQAPMPVVYTCQVAPTPMPQFFARTTGDPTAVAGAVRARLNELEPLRSVYEIVSLEQRIADFYAANRLRTWLITVFAAASLALTCLGVYGTLSYVVSLRRREVGLRVALGALSATIVREFLRKVLRVVGVACGAGLVLSYAFARSLSGLLYGVAPFDPVTLSSVVVLVVAVACAAAFLPAVSAARVDPVKVLRED